MKTSLFFKITLITLLFAETVAFSQAGRRTNPVTFDSFYGNVNISYTLGTVTNQNDWTSTDNSAFQPSKDVTFMFSTLVPQRIILSTVYPETNFDTYIHLVKLNWDGTFNSYIAGNDDSGGSTKSQLQSDLCPGFYGIVVEGYGSNSGYFKLSFQSSSISPTSGSIAISTNNSNFVSLCPNAGIPAINSTENATSTVGSITYFWYKATYNNGTWSSWVYYPDAGSGPSAMALGTIGTDEVVAFYRQVQACGGVNGTSSVLFYRYSITANGGKIGINGAATTMMIPTPQEQANGQIVSLEDAIVLSPAFTISWEKNVGGTGWVDAGANGQTFTIPPLSTSTQYRRKITSTCTGVQASSNTVTMNVVIPNGVISGMVKSKTGAGVSNVTITAVRTSTPPSGGVANKTYTTTTTTNPNGTYSFNTQGLYYGDPANGSGASATFRVTPSKGTGLTAHIFEQPYLDITITPLVPVVSNVDFTDKTTFSITGKVTQECATCVTDPPTAPLVCNIKDVEFLVDDKYVKNTTNPDGTYTLSVDEQRSYTIKPHYKNHKFAPDKVNLPVGENPSIDNVNFKDTTTFTISGKVLAGCGEYIGTTTLRFTQVLPPNNGNPVTGCLIKEITTNQNAGYYAIRLPAGKYRASVVGFTPDGTGSDLNNLTVKEFLNNNVLNQDSLIRNIDSTNRVLNLVYPRAPVLEVIGLATVCTAPNIVCSTGTFTEPYSLMAQNDSTAFTIKVWQGPAKTCPAKDSSVYLSTNIQHDATSEDFTFVNRTGVIEKKLKGGTPNIVCPYFKTFNLRFTDRFRRAAESINKNVVVTGIKADIGAFTTVSPEIPLKVLHNPPGDNSYSFWESNTSTEEAIRMFRANSTNAEAWAEIKLGTKFATGIGLSVETEAWGTIKGSIGVGGRNVTSNETILSFNTTQRYETGVGGGAQGDVFIGSAINLLYARAHIISYSACTLTNKTDFIIAPNGFATDYAYSESFIVNNILPTLRDLRDNPSTLNSVAQKAKYSNQISVWEQVLSNNTHNKKTAPFEKNLSFDGRVGAISSSTTATSTKTNTIEFGLELNAELAIELGFESSGSGVSGGAVVNTKLETGGSTTNTTLKSTTTGYLLDDKNNGDYFSIDIKKDPVYDTPVFELVAGTSSCPWEAGTQPRDDMQLVCAVPTQTVADPAGDAEFILQLSNISQSGEARTYLLSFDQSSNPNGAVVTIGGSPAVGSTAYSIAYGGSIPVVVRVKRGASNIFAYTGLKFVLSDSCTGSISKTVSLNAYFNSPCSPITLFSPLNGFSINTNTVPIIMKDYNVANLTSVSLEYSKVGTISWLTGFTKTAAQLSTDPSGTQVNWDISTLTDGQYNFRLKLLCSTNVIYTPTVSGVIDRIAPILFGNPEPADDNYVIGDQISASYNEVLGCANMNNTNLVLKNLKTNAIIPAQFGCYENKVMIVPLSSMGFSNDSMRVTLLNIRDLAGNIKTTPDSWKFILGNTVAATGNTAVSLNSSTVIASSNTETNGVLATNVAISMLENATGTLDFYFNLPANVPNDYLINFSISGSANPSNDYTVSFFPNKFIDGRLITSNKFNGTTGSITILKDQKTAKLSIDPTGDSIFEGDETIIISIIEGGDYGIGASYTMTGIILNDDADDCLNGGNVYVLTNNNVSNTAIVDGTYQKSLIETAGTVEAPSRVTIKAAKSLTLKPGFKVKSGSIFKATIEGCPPSPAAFSVPITETNNQKSNNIILASNYDGLTPVTETVSNNKFEPNVLAAVNDQKVFFEFKLDKNENVTLVLLNDFAGEKLRIIDGEAYKAGIYNVEIDISTLKQGDYYLQLTTSDKKTYQKITIK